MFRNLRGWNLLGRQKNSRRANAKRRRHQRAQRNRLFAESLEPRLLLATDINPAASIDVVATDADNAIAFTIGDNTGTATVGGATSAQVSIDNQAPVEFANKGALRIFARAGRDVIYLNNSTRPTGNGGGDPFDVVEVFGGTPTTADGDVLVVADANPDTDPIQVTSTSVVGALGTNAAPIGVNYAEIERLVIDGIVGNDVVQIFSGASNETMSFTPLTTADSGAVEISGMVPIDFENVGADGFVTLVDGGGTDSLLYQGLDGDDVITLGASATSGLIGLTASGIKHTTAQTFGIENLTLEGGNGDDTFSITAPPTSSPPFPYATLHISGGNPSASDTATLTGNGTDINVTFNADSSVQVTGGGLGTVTLVGVELINIEAGAGNIEIDGTSGPDAFSVTPNGANTAIVQIAGLTSQVNTTNTGTLKIDDSNGGGDSLTVNLGAAGETVTVNETVVEVTAPASSPVKKINYTFPNSTTTNGIESLRVNGNEGIDSFDVTPSANTPAIFIDGGDPLGSSGDGINIQSGNTAVQFSLGAQADEGTFVVGTMAAISFDHIERASTSGGSGTPTAAVTITANNADNDITIIGDDTGTATTFTVSVDDGPEVKYTNAATLTVNALSGDDDITLEVNDLALVGTGQITINGGQPGGGDADTLNVRGDTGSPDAASWTPSASGAGLLSVHGQTINLVDTETLIYDGESENETLTVLGTVGGDDAITHTPGDAPDSGSVRVNALLAVDYVRLGTGVGAAVAINGQGNATATGDTLQVVGTAGADSFGLSPNITLNNRVPITSTNVENYALQGLGGDDVFNITPVTGVNRVTAQGDEPGSGSDVLNFDADTAAGNNVGLNLATSTISQTVGADIVYSGIETVNIDANPAGASALQNLTATASDLSDLLVVTPSGANSGSFQANNTSPIVNFADVATFTVDLAGGGDSLVVNGSLGPETITVTGALVTPGTNETVNYTNAEGLTVNGREGADTFNVTPAAIPMSIVGGAPVGSLPGDAINIVAGGNDVAFNPGVEADEGTFVVAGSAGAITYDQIESASVTGATNADLTISGNNADNDITIVGTGTNDFTVSVDAGPSIQYNNFDSLTVNALAGDDDISLEVNALTLTTVPQITINGGQPGGGDADTLSVRGDAGADNASWTPSASGAGVLAVHGQTVNLIDTETLIYDGESENETLTVVGEDANNDLITHTPGDAPDSGRVRVDALLAVDYVRLGTGGFISIDGRGQGTGPNDADVLLAQGTAGTDSFNVATGVTPAPVLPTITLNNRVGITTTNVEQYEIQGLGGDDAFNITPVSGVNRVTAQGDEPGRGSDVLNFNAGPALIAMNLATSTISQSGVGDVVYSGIETVNIDANPGATTTGQSLTVTASDLSDLVEVTPSGPNSGSFQANNTSPIVNFADVNVFTVDLAGGGDSLVVNGSLGPETITVTGALVTPGTNETVNYTNAEGLTVNGREGADTFNVTPAAIPMSIVGGAPVGSLPGDTINIAAGANNVAFNPGVEADEGTFVVSGSAGAVTYDQIESASVTGAAGANLTISGNNADNDITIVGTGTDDFTVSVDAGPSIQYNNFSSLTVNSLAGDDDISLEVNALALGTAPQITIDGGQPGGGDADTLSVRGDTGADNASWTPSASGAGVLSVHGQTVNLVDTETLIYDGESEDETLTVVGEDNDNDLITHTPGDAPDSGRVRVDALLAVDYVRLGTGGTISIDGRGQGTGATDADVLLAVGTPGTDNFNVGPGTTLPTITLNNRVGITTTNVEQYEMQGLGGDDAFHVTPVVGVNRVTAQGDEPGSGSDVLNFNAGPALIAMNLATSTISQAGVGDVVYSGIETVNIDANPGATTTGQSLSVTASDLSDLLEVTPSGPDSGSFQANNTSPIVNFADVDVFTVDLAGGGDSLVVNGSLGPEVMTVTRLLVTPGTNETVNYTNAESLTVNGRQGADTFNVNPNQTTPPANSIPISIVGGAPVGSLPGDALNITASSNDVAFNPGVEADEGTFVVAGSSGAITYDQIESASVTGAAGADLTVSGNNADNDITIVGSGTNDFTVSVDAGPSIQYNDFDSLTVNSLAGDDDISLEVNALALGTAPQITIDGGQPGGGDADTLSVRGDTGADNASWTPSASGAGLLSVHGQTVNLIDTETLIYDGESENETLTVVGEDNDNDRITHTPGDAPDSGRVRVDALLAIDYVRLGTDGVVSIDGQGQGAGTNDADVLLAVGTAGTDIFRVAPGTTPALPTINLNDRVRITTTQVEQYEMQGLGGDDTFNVTPVTGVNQVTAQGDEPGNGSDVLNFTSDPSSTNDVTLNLGASTISQTQAGSSDIVYAGIETINATLGAADLTIQGTSGDDNLTVTLLSATSGSAQANNHSPVVNYVNTDSEPITVDLGDGTDQDTLIVIGNSIEQELDINATDGTVNVQNVTPPRTVPARTVNVIDSGGVAAGSVNWTADGIESLAVHGLESRDIFRVTPRPLTTAPPVPIFIDGGDPIGKTSGDRLEVDGNGAGVTFEGGPEPDEGSFLVTNHGRISWDHIEELGVANATKAIIVGTDADDEITVIARTEQTNPSKWVGANGVQDFTSSLNEYPEILWLNVPQAYIDALNGDDDITVRAPAPNGADWNVEVYVAGGPSSSPTNGDRLRIETPASNDTLSYQPTGPDSGILTLATVSSNIYVGSFTVDCDNDGIPNRVSGPGGVEYLVYDGISSEGLFAGPGANQSTPTAFTDNLTILGDGFAQALADERFIHTPGDAPDSGRIEVVDGTNNQTMLPLHYTHIGADAVVTLNGQAGADTLVTLGTDGSDSMAVDFTASNAIDVDVTSAAGTHVDVRSVDVESFEIRAEGGDDSVAVTGPVEATGTFAVLGGEPGTGSDTLGLTGLDGRTDAVSILPDATASHDQDITGLGTTIDVSGIELARFGNLDDADDWLRVVPGLGDNTVVVDAASLANTDRVASDSLPAIEFTNATRFIVDTSDGAANGSDVVRVKTRFLSGVNGDTNSNRSYELRGDAADTALVEGVDGDGDGFTVTNPPAGVLLADSAVDPLAMLVDPAATSPVRVLLTGTAHGKLQVDTLGGSDILFVDVDAGTGSDLINVPISYNGDGGFDSLVVRGTPNGTPPAATYAPGPQVDGGQVIHSGATTQLIEFTGLEPVLDLVPGPLSVLGTNADNTINYRPGFVNAANNGVVEVDDFETYEFSNKTTLTINGLAGDDLVNLNNPNTPTALTGITVNGDDATGADVATSDDVLVVHGTLGADTINFTPTAGTEDAGQVTGAQPVTVTFATTESLVIDGEGDTAGTGDALTITSPTGANTITYTPGVNVDSGQVLVDNLAPMTFRGLDALGTAGTQGNVSFADAAPARSDTLVHRGSDSDDVFSVAASGDVTLANNPGTHVTASTPGVSHLTLDGLDGTDTFTVNAAHPFTLIQVDGGGSDVGDVLNLDDATGRNATIVADLAASTVAGFGSVAGELVKFDGLEQVYINGTDGTDTLTVNGTTDDDLLTYTPNGPQAGRFYSDGHPSLFIFENIASTFTVDLLTDVGDEVAVEGTRNSDTITVDSPARTVTVENAAGVVLKPVVLANSVETATVLGREGSDTTVVVPAGAVATGVAGGPAGTLKPINLRVNVDGGDSSPSDSLVIAADATGTPLDNATHFVIVNHSRQEDEGVVRIFRDTAGAGNDPAQLPDISFVDVHHVAPLLQGVTASQQPNLLILGPDMYEENEYLGTAGMLGTGKRLNVENLAIFPNAPEVRFAPADQDWFRVVAEQTGTLDVQVYFQQRDPEVLPGAGDLQLQVYDADGNLISGFGSDESSPTDQDERVRIPAVAGQTYFIRVFGANDTVVNGYDMVVLNDAPPVPYDIELDDFLVNGTPNPPGQTDNSDTGRSHHDNITYDDTPTIRFRLDDAIFLHDIQGNPTNAQNNPPDQNIPIPFNSSTDVNNTTAGFRVPVFIEGTPQEPGQQPQVLVGFAQPVAGVEGVYEFDFANAVVNLSTVTSGLDDGSHFINAKVQIIDPSGTTQRGLGGRSQSLEVVVDTVPPPVFFGLQSQPLDGLHPDSDTGNPLQEETFSDRITSDRTPTFWGLAEADVLVRLYVDMDSNDIVSPGDVFIGESVAVPFDGNNQFGNLTADQPNGQWELTSTVNLNDPNLSFPKDGLRRILVNAEDVAGNISNPQVFEIFLDTQGPRVYDPDGPGGVSAVHITDDPATTRDESLYDLFDPKPSVDGPTPLANSITVNIEDLPIRLPGLPASFLYPALKTPLHVVDHATGLLIDADGGGPLPAGRSPLDVGYFQVRGDSNGIIPIDKIWFDSDVVVSGDRATGVIIIEFPEPLQDDRYTLIVRDDLTDHPGNALDGEMDTVEPQDSSTYEFPSGDLLPGGDFLARFTIDTRPEIAVYAAGSVWVDTNGNALFDPTNQDFTNRDITYKLGYTTDDLFAGNFAGPGVDGFWGTADDDAADGFDKLASYGRIGSGFRWLIDYDNDGVPDAPTPLAESTLHINGLPFAGNFDNNPVNGDEVGLFDGETWYFDTDHDFQVDRTYVNPNLSGIPIVGDFDGDGHDDLGTWKDDWFTFELSNGQDKSWLGDNVGDSPVLLNKDFGFIGVREIPVAADMDMDGIDDFGLWVPDRTGVNPEHVSEWYFLVSGEPGHGGIHQGTLDAFNAAFTPIPFSTDMYATFGDEFAAPLVGNFDPPVSASLVQPLQFGNTNIDDAADINGDGLVTAVDVLILINELNSTGSRALGAGPMQGPYLDPTGDNFLAPQDPLVVINRINARVAGASGEAEGEAANVQFVSPTLASPVAYAPSQSESADSFFAQAEGEQSLDAWYTAEEAADTLLTPVASESSPAGAEVEDALEDILSGV